VPKVRNGRVVTAVPADQLRQHRGNQWKIDGNFCRRIPLFSPVRKENDMIRISAIVAGVLALSASTVMAQGNVASVPGGETTGTQTWPQQAQAPRHETRPIGNFIFDEYGNVYDSHGDIIKPRPLKR
jgi:hypothetical protein